MYVCNAAVDDQKFAGHLPFAQPTSSRNCMAAACWYGLDTRVSPVAAHTSRYPCQALTTHSVFVMDWTRPVPLTEYFLPFDDALGFDGHRACLSAPELRWAKHNPMVESSQRRNDTAIQETIAAAEGASAVKHVLPPCVITSRHLVK